MYISTRNAQMDKTNGVSGTVNSASGTENGAGEIANDEIANRGSANTNGNADTSGAATKRFAGRFAFTFS
jgi:hypothetical protein